MLRFSFSFYFFCLLPVASLVMSTVEATTAVPSSIFVVGRLWCAAAADCVRSRFGPWWCVCCTDRRQQPEENIAGGAVRLLC